MRVLGVDPGLGRCGWAVLEGRGGRARAVGYGTVHTEGEEVAPRLAELATKLRQVLAAHRPEALAIERLFFNANVRTAMTVGQASGVVLLLAAEHGLQVSAYTPPQVKQAVTGSGSAPKEQVGYRRPRRRLNRNSTNSTMMMINSRVPSRISPPFGRTAAYPAGRGANQTERPEGSPGGC